MTEEIKTKILQWIMDNHEHHEGSDRTEMNLSDGYVVTHKDEFLCNDGNKPYVNSLALEEFVNSFPAPKSAYLVTSGDYSDYRVEGVFSTEANAKAYLDKRNESAGGYGDADIEVYQLDVDIDQIRNGYSLYRVCMSKNGEQFPNTGSYDLKVRKENPVEGVYTRFQVKWKKGKIIDYPTLKEAIANTDKNTETYIIATAWAKDEQHAIKIVNERRIELLAQDVWPLPSVYHATWHKYGYDVEGWIENSRNSERS